ncbi:zinc-binding dehydrogenase [Martelella lutilitoris]|uniref:Zinc-binding dehydrogenase n=1 Tax=Martelella lutilitoris TaxID=2583532 RepID=A0A5C4JXA8_9HYPH|nr:zinc-binding dehydrogenase [Martelella lutilitoris]TNB49269.1 zinc-binding dehydrogenase [Martelella lutilitoris]
MLAVIHDTFGEPADVLVARETATPVPGSGQVLVRMKLSPIHNHDLWTIRGNYGYKPELPGAIGGSEALGVIEKVGADVDQAMVGKRVAVAGVHGSWAEFFIAPAGSVLPLPDEISDEDGAQLIAMPFSAISLLETLRAKKGDWIIQTAANGAVGKLMTTLAKSHGINLVSLVRRKEAVKELHDLGIGNVFSTADEDWKDEVRALIGEDGATSAIDSVGGDTAADLVDLLGVDGELVVFGTATGAPMPLSSGTLIMKHITVRGFWGSRVSKEMDDEKRKTLIGELVALAAKGELQLETDEIFPLQKAADAASAALKPGRKGKVMLHP